MIRLGCSVALDQWTEVDGVEGLAAAATKHLKLIKQKDQVEISSAFQYCWYLLPCSIALFSFTWSGRNFHQKQFTCLESFHLMVQCLQFQKWSEWNDPTSSLNIQNNLPSIHQTNNMDHVTFLTSFITIILFTVPSVIASRVYYSIATSSTSSSIGYIHWNNH